MFVRFLAVILLWSSLAGAQTPRKIAIIGDSLSREYQFEFADFPGARNWVEILAARRPADLDFGDYSRLDSVFLSFLCLLPQIDQDICDALDVADDLFYYDCNKAVPGFTAQDYRDNITNVFNPVNIAFRGWAHPAIDDADVVVIFIGGNDIDRVYHQSPLSVDTAVDDLFGNINWLIDHVKDRNGNADIIITNVPHVGATPQLKADPNTTPVNTQRITNALNSLSAQLQALAVTKGAAFADVYSLTLDLLDPAFYCIGGVRFENASTDGIPSADHPRYMWLGGPLSDNFHPNTQGQAIVANAIIEAMNTKFGYNITPLSNREIVEDVVGLPYDLAFQDWLAGYGLAGESQGDDSERDGIRHLLEMALDFDPTKFDQLPSPVLSGGHLTLTYPVRDQDCEYVSIWPQYSANGSSWLNADAAMVSDNNDGTFTFSMATAGHDLLFVRLRAEER